ncbi:GIY-YIG nuclease family protein [Erythrobacter sp. NFXS35]|uniref:GIY-YIG nuclease family protein n=1 Tax=Erythrobacter sp. NFXS35 TaxID=2818436 RepID=UPI0032DF7E2B
MAVYFVAASGTEFCKVGWAVNPDARLISLQTANPHMLAKLAYLHVADQQIEFELHRELCKANVRGEWFQLIDVAKLLLSKGFNERFAETVEFFCNQRHLRYLRNTFRPKNPRLCITSSEVFAVANADPFEAWQATKRLGAA